MIRKYRARHVVPLANADYELEKCAARDRGHETALTVRMIERRWGLVAGQLLSYRANEKRRMRRSRALATL